jgi:hypothetical protein
MTVDVYIGELSTGADPLDWGGDWNGNAPVRKSPFFPPSAPFYKLKEMISSGKFPGKQVDWGGWAARVSKQDILDFVAEAYRGNTYYTDPNAMPHLYQDMQTLMSYIHALPDDRSYALAATEL